MITLTEILSNDQLGKYKEEWKNFKGKYRVNSLHNVHSGMPVISEVYQFEDKHLFRAHVFGKRLRKFDPYFIAKKCIQPFWHAQHYLIVAEQIYIASSKLLIGDRYNKMIAKDVPVEFTWKKPLFWSDNISVELIIREFGKAGKYEKQNGYFTFYLDKSRKILSTMSADSYWKERTYVQLMNQLNNGYDNEALEKLKRIIEIQSQNNKRITPPRKNFNINKNDLISRIENGELPEEELHNFFSLWDK